MGARRAGVRVPFRIGLAAAAVLGSVATVSLAVPPALALGPNAIRPGFDSTAFPGNDDGSTGLVPLGFTADFFGTDYTHVFVNNNGNVTFDAPLGTFTPFPISTTNRVIIAPFFADVDTRTGNVVAYGAGTVGGRPAFGVTWPGVGCFAQITSVLNHFQVILVDRSDTGAGNFDIEFNYDQIQWETGQASGGSAVCQGGSSARVGYSNGTPDGSFELPGSGVNGALLDSNLATGLVNNSLNSGGQLGRYRFTVRDGVVAVCTSTLTGDVLGPVTVSGTDHVCIVDARVVGPVTVEPGGALSVSTSSTSTVVTQISRGIVADSPSFLSVCGSRVASPPTSPSQGVVVSNATGPVRIGDPATECAANRVAGDVTLTGNTAGLTLGSNIVSGNVTVNNNTGTSVIKANNIFKILACSGNVPAPTDAGQPNAAASKTGQCSAL